MDQDATQATSNGDEWGADSNEQSAFGSPVDVDGKFMFLHLQFIVLPLVLRFFVFIRWLG
jgi:hypothetical protein